LGILYPAWENHFTAKPQSARRKILKFKTALATPIPIAGDVFFAQQDAQ